MILFLIGCILGAIILSQDSYGLWDGLVSVFFGLIIGGFVGIVIALFIGFFIPQTFDYTKVPLVALKDNITTQGKFFLGSGHVNSTLKYFYFRKEGRGYKADSKDSEKSIIYEDEEKTPYLKVYVSRFKNENFILIAIPLNEKDSEFHIPKNSILQDYKLDLSN